MVAMLGLISHGWSCDVNGDTHVGGYRDMKIKHLRLLILYLAKMYSAPLHESMVTFQRSLVVKMLLAA